MKLIDRYLSKNILYPTISIITILSLIILITQSFKYIDLMISHGINSVDFFYVTALLVPSLLFIITPICLFIAIIYSLNKLNSHRELNILKGVGISNFAIAKPVLRITLFVTIIHYFLALYLTPVINHRFKDLVNDLKENYISFFLQEKVFNHPTDFLTFYIKNKINDNKFEQIFYQDSRNAHLITIIAENGELLKKDNKIFLNLIKGNRQEVNKDGELTILYFDTLLVQLDFNKNSSNLRELTMQEKNIFELLFPNKNTDPGTRTRMIAEASNRLTWPFYNITLTLLALSALLVGGYNREGKTKRIIFFSCLTGLIVIINNSLINLSSTYASVIILSYLFTFGIFGALTYFLFYRETDDL